MEGGDVRRLLRVTSVSSCGEHMLRLEPHSLWALKPAVDTAEVNRADEYSDVVVSV